MKYLASWSGMEDLVDHESKTVDERLLNENLFNQSDNIGAIVPQSSPASWSGSWFAGQMVEGSGV